ncbi:mechanosensitive ion channel family protein [Erythrobacter rubeus]|uniref:Small-conductance mechanosensitive channel n=1 Tax=Erythrobacter rubeus TaxID=2760803 RepID=A0ABR8KRP8_9SPHN|nr:mechanosensitive ion channel family protein [Erythrobacter rubeus]MBD2843443.1 mechanosensitive ion channel [Erythrobacter rubeus]
MAVPSLAVLPALEPSADEAEAAQPVEQTISQGQGEGDDARITERIEGIFAELPDFGTVEVETSEGVVSLTGTLADAEAIARAEGIASRVAGVVTVENAIERDLSVEQNLSVLGEMTGLFDSFVSGLPLFAVAVLVALVIGALGYLIAGLGFIWDRIAPNAFLSELIRSAIRFAFVVGGIVIALDMLGAGALLGAVLGGAGVIGIALGFAMRDTIENYVASVMLSLRQPFRPNDHVLIDDLEGKVIRLTSRATVLMTLEGNHLRVPNSQVFKAVIVNFTRNPQRRFSFELGIDADDDPRAAMQLGGEVLQGLPFVLGEPEPAARINQVGDSNIVILFLGWIDQREADWFKSRSLAIAAVKEALEEAGFALPEPIYRLRFDGRTDPLPIGRSAKDSPKTPSPGKKRASATSGETDVRPESEISEMVENERQSDPEQAKDLLDPSRPVE